MRRVFKRPCICHWQYISQIQGLHWPPNIRNLAEREVCSGAVDCGVALQAVSSWIRIPQYGSGLDPTPN
jgi:hypothetical protein